MNEYRAESGGRFTFAEDFLNLQELALANASIFEGHGDFVISGCEFETEEIKPGIVYLEGKLRKFNGAYIEDDVTTLYIVPTYLAVNTPYANGANKLGTEEYGCSATTIRPSSGKYITIKRGSKSGRMDEEYYAKKMLMLHPENDSQKVDGNLEVEGVVRADVVKTPEIAVGASDNYYSATISDSNEMHMAYGVCDITIGKYGRIIFTIDGYNVLSLDSQSVLIEGNGTASFQTAYNYRSYANNIDSPIQYKGTMSDTLNINLGRENGSYTNTVIGDGKGKELVMIDGASGQISIQCDNGVLIEAPEDSPAVTYSIRKNGLGAYLPITVAYSDGTSTGVNHAFTQYAIVNRETGFRTGTYGEYTIFAPSVRIHGTTINLEGAIFENGVALSNKYSMLNGGLSQFLIDGVDKAELRRQIGAIGTGDSTQVSDSLKKYIDESTANTEAGFQNLTRMIPPKDLRQQIGALGKDDIEPNDTGWLEVPSFTLGTAKLRCIGGVVYLKVSCSSWPNDTQARSFDFESLTKIPAPDSACINFVTDASSGIYKVSAPANEKKFVIQNTVQSNDTSGALEFICTIL